MKLIFQYTSEDQYEDINVEYDEKTDAWFVDVSETTYDAGRAKIKMTNLAVLAMTAAILEEFQGEQSVEHEDTTPPSP